MRVDLDKNLNKNVFHTIETAIGYAPKKSAWNKISYVIFVIWHKLQKKKDNTLFPNSIAHENEA